MLNRIRARIRAARRRAAAWRRIVAKRIRQLREALKRKRERNLATTMYDSVTIGEIPADAPAVAGYTSGLYPTFPILERRFPRAQKLSIAISDAYDADCLDIENGDAVPADAPQWVRRQKRRGVKRPVVYSSVSSMREVIAALAKDGLGLRDVRVWTAHYTYEAHICGPHTCGQLPWNADGCQFTDRALGRNLDQSLLRPDFFA